MTANHEPHVLVLGASGRVGGQVCRQLLDAIHLLWPFFASAEAARPKATPIAKLLGARVPRVVHVSAEGAATDRDSFWAVLEDAVAEHVQEWTFLRPTGSSANALQWAPQILRGRVVR